MRERAAQVREDEERARELEGREAELRLLSDSVRRRGDELAEAEDHQADRERALERDVRELDRKVAELRRREEQLDEIESDLERDRERRARRRHEAIQSDPPEDDRERGRARADVAALLEILVGSTRVLQCEGAVDMRTYPTLVHTLQEVLHPCVDFGCLVPQVADIHSEGGPVLVHQHHWIEPGHAEGHLQQAKPSAHPRLGCRGNPEHAQPSGAAQHPPTLAPVRTTKRIDDQLDTATVGEPADFPRPVAAAVIDRLLHPAFLQERVLGGARRAEDAGADVDGDVDRRQTNSASRVMDQHRLIGRQGPHHHQQLPRRQIVHRQGCCLLMGQRGRLSEYLPLSDDHGIGITTEASHREHFTSDPVGTRARTGGIDNAAHLVAHHARRLGCIRIKALAGQHVGEVDPGSPYPDAHLADPWCRIRSFTNPQLIRAAITGDDDLTHRAPPAAMTPGTLAGRVVLAGSASSAPRLQR